MSEDWARVRRVFEAALDREPVERERFLDEACGSNTALRAEVAALLRAHDGADGFIEAPGYQAAASLLVDEHAPNAGQALGPYVIRQEIGRGGMGVVYLADDTRLSRRVALKGLAPGAVSEAAGRERLRKEARAAAALSHPGIATVYALEEIDSELYLASEYVPGLTLRATLAQGPLPFALVIDIAIQLAHALAAAHAQGVVHRDLKPENIVRTTAGVVKILDFGLARADHVAATGLTLNQPGAGTPGYMAPEQIRGDDVDFRADLFAFGVVVYELASGTNPFAGPTPTATMARILQDAPEPLARVGPSRFAVLDGVVAACLAKDRRERYGSTRELVADLERLERDPSAARLTGRRSAEGRRAWWWEVHQIVVVVVYVALLYPTWQARHWLGQPWATLFLCSMAAFAAVAATARLHLWFTSRHYPAELPAQRLRARGWTQGSDLALTATLLGAGLAIAPEHQATAMLLVASAIAAALSSFLIEPATARAAFGE